MAGESPRGQAFASPFPGERRCVVGRGDSEIEGESNLRGLPVIVSECPAESLATAHLSSPVADGIVGVDQLITEAPLVLVDERA